MSTHEQTAPARGVQMPCTGKGFLPGQARHRGPSRTGALSRRQLLFLQHYRGRARGNATKAAILAGYSRNGANSKGSQLLANVSIRAALTAQLAKAEQIEKADAVERDRICSRIARDLQEDTLARLQAIKELNKVDGRHTIHHQIEGKVTLEQALAASRDEEDEE